MGRAMTAPCWQHSRHGNPSHLSSRILPVSLALFFAAAGAAFVLTSGGDAEAISRTHGAGFCRNLSSTQTDDEGLNEVFNNNTTLYLYLGCPMMHDSYLSVANVNDLDVYGYDGSNETLGEVLVALCASNWTGGSLGGECDDASGSGGSFTGNYQIDFNSFPGGWASAPTAYWPYLNVSVPPKDGSSKSSIRGYRWTAP